MPTFRKSIDPVPPGEITELLARSAEGSAQAQAELYPLVYSTLRRLAASRLACEPSTPSLSPTELVHETYLRLGGHAGVSWSHRRHFFSAAAQAMRRIMVERARHRLAAKRGGGRRHLLLDDVERGGSEAGSDALQAEATPDEVLLVDDLLKHLAQHDQSAAEVVVLRYFGGFEFGEIAKAMDCSERTILRRWALARAWIGTQQAAI